ASPFDEKATARLLRKIDWTLIPFLSLLYLLSFLDRSNIGNARLAGLEKSLGMTGLDYNNVLAIFFPFYVLAEIPSNIVMKASRPSVWIPTLMVAWGLMCILMGLVKNYAGLLAIRAALGLAEGGLFPGIAFFLTMWYRRYECGLRLAIFFSAATVAGAFGGLIARGIMQMDSTAGLKSWQWIFILEGMVTFVVGVSAFYFMFDYADTAKFLNKEERTEVKRRLEDDCNGLADEFSWSFIFDAFKDWKIWVHMAITLCIFTCLYSFSLFLPTIIKSLGYTNNSAQLMSVPPYVVACFLCISAGFIEDRHRQRGIYQIGFCLVAMVGFIMLLASESSHVKYAGTFLAAAGIYPNVPACVAWNSNNIGGSTKRSVGIAMQVLLGNLGGVISGYSFLPKDEPRYIPGYGMLAGMCAFAALLSFGMAVYLRIENKSRGERNAKKPEEYTAAEKIQERDLGDYASFFRYTV
ncbi:major facilitator superfamily transporter, partial [Rhizodiscina lignyota]